MAILLPELSDQGPEFDMDSLLVAWQEAVFALYLDEGKIEPEVVENMRSWQHSGFSVDQSVHLPAGDRAGIERLVQYMVRCPFSRAPSRSDGRRLVKVKDLTALRIMEGVGTERATGCEWFGPRPGL